jgi:transcription antitermination factor NusG
LYDLGIQTYLPFLKLFKKYLGRGQRQVEPMFPGYILALIERDPDRFYLRGVRGFVSVVCFDGRPARLDPGLVEDFRRRENGKGYICARPPARGLCSLDPVRIVDGPFAGHKGLFVRSLDGAERVCILLEILKRQALVELPHGSVEAALPEAAPHLSGQDRYSPELQPAPSG